MKREKFGLRHHDVAFSLDAIGRVDAASNGYSRSDFSYADPSGRLAGVSAQTHNASGAGYAFDSAFGYDDNSNVKSISATLPNGVGMNASFDYDEMNRLAAAGPAGAPASGRVDFAYDAASRLTGVTLPNSVATSYDYDDANRLTGYAVANPALPAEGYAARTFARNEIGAIISASDPAEGVSAFAYDIMDRLTGATYPQSLHVILPAEKYSYGEDGLGHRESSLNGRLVDPATRLPATVDYNVDPDNDQLIDDSVYTYAYDLNGNMTGKTRKDDASRTQYDYDVFDRLAAVREFGGPTPPDIPGEPPVPGQQTGEITYLYDWSGRLIEKNVCIPTGGGSDSDSGENDLPLSGATHNPVVGVGSEQCTTTRYAYQGLNLIAELDENNNVLVRYNHAPGTLDRPLSMQVGEQVFYYHYDERGSVSYLTNAKGHIVQKYVYDSFGRIVMRIGNLPNAFTYTGRHWDPDAKLYHYRARVYDPELGIFLQQDPVYSANPYSYVGNDPINAIDPLGLSVTYTRSFDGYWICETCSIENENLSASAIKAWRKRYSYISEKDHSRTGSFGSGGGWGGECWLRDRYNDECSLKCKDSNDFSACLEACKKGPNDAPDGGSPPYAPNSPYNPYGPYGPYGPNSPNNPGGRRPGSPVGAPQGPGPIPGNPGSSGEPVEKLPDILLKNKDIIKKIWNKSQDGQADEREMGAYLSTDGNRKNMPWVCRHLRYGTATDVGIDIGWLWGRCIGKYSKIHSHVNSTAGPSFIDLDIAKDDGVKYHHFVIDEFQIHEYSYYGHEKEYNRGVLY
ncbi:MAG: RHS repeat-associated core domain-containing protein [bacterium]